MEGERNGISAKRFITFMTCATFMGLGICRTIFGPTMIDLLEYIKSKTKDLQFMFGLCSGSLPLGNFLGGILIVRSPTYLFMALVVMLMAVFFATIPFASSLFSLTFVVAVAEFFIGLVDTACNVSILKLWNDERSAGVYFSCMHFFYSVGNLLGPVMVEAFLPEKNESNATLMENSDDWSRLANIRIIYLILASYLLIIAKILIICDKFAVETLPEENEGDANQDMQNPEKKFLDKKGQTHLRNLFFFCMAMVMGLSYGINFAYSNFLPIFAVNSKLKLNTSQGARATTIFFGCAAVMKLVSIGLLRIMRPIFLLNISMAFLAMSGIALFLYGEESSIIFTVGSGMASLGASLLFPVGIAWIQSQCNLESQMTSVLVISTTLGAQLTKIPMSTYVEDNPASLMIIFAVCAILIIFFLVLAQALCFMASYRENSSSTTAQEEAPPLLIA